MNIWRVPYPKFGDGPGLERVRVVAARLGVNLAHFGESGAAIVGSNGRGSTAAMTAVLLGQVSENVGLFTSPHLFALNERFRIGDDDISDEELGRHWSRVMDAVASAGLSEKLGGFEFLFIIAADWFAARGCAHTVWEAGIGGRFDPVKLIEAKRLALTSLDLEHTELLGETLEQIGLDKVEAAPAGATIYAAVWTSERETLARRCEEMGVRYVTVPPYYGAELPLSGRHQNQNAALALHVAMSLTNLDDEELAPRFATTRWPGRLEVIGDDPFTVIDVGHTPAAVRAALVGFQQMRGEHPGVLVCGASVDKDAATIISALAPAFSTIICAAAHHKGAPAAIVAAHAAAANPSAEIAIADSVADAHRLAETRAKAVAAAIFVAGGLFLAGEYKAVHMGRDPASLAFF